MTTKKKWSMKYKKSINCNNPKGFSQKQHCKYWKKKRTLKNLRGGTIPIIQSAFQKKKDAYWSQTNSYPNSLSTSVQEEISKILTPEELELHESVVNQSKN
jgi:hypothetical protein